MSESIAEEAAGADVAILRGRIAELEDECRSLRAENEARLHGISLRLDLAGSLPATTADQLQIQQVILNIVCNGVEAYSGRLSVASGDATGSAFTFALPVFAE